jgi:galactoside 2-L-fucosyltransferase 1/2
MRSSKHVYGFGTVMVDVRSLGKKLADDRNLGTLYATKKTLTGLKDESKANNVCFDLSLGRTRNFENNLFTSRPIDIFTARQSLESYNLFTMDSFMKHQGERNAIRRHCNSYITVDSPPGRSGNQMFQIAALLGTAYNLDLIPVIPPNSPLSEWVELPNLVDLNLTDAQLFVMKSSGRYSRDINYLNNKKNWTLRGYFQSWKYFSNAGNIVKNAFKIKDSYLGKVESFIRNISRPGQVNVCVHVRRGDLSDHVAMRKGYSIAGTDFIKNAMNFYRGKFRKVKFIVLSDGIQWCMDHIKGIDVMFSPFYRYAEDMALMTLCDHVIVTSGTFGWWGAWLSGGTTVYFKGYPRPESWLASQVNRNDYYPKGWIPM